MTRRSPSLLVGLCAIVALTAAAPASAFWKGSGVGVGLGATATMPTGSQPSGSVAGQSVTVSWTQSSFLSNPLGAYGGGGYTLRRYASGSTTPITPNANCATKISGTGTTLQCIEASVPFGAWQYSVTPVLNTFTGVESTKSTSVTVAVPPPASVTATAGPAARIDIAWASASGVAGYNVYRRTSSGSYNFAAPLNGGTPVAGLTYADTTASNGTVYFYTVRAVGLDVGGAQIESTGIESASVIADGVAPSAPTSASVTSGGNVTLGPSCTIATGTRYVNNTGKASVGVSATIVTPESGETVVFSATTPGSTPVTATVAAVGTSVSTTMDLSSLLDGTVTFTARTKDVAGNVSATKAPANAIIKDIVAATLSSVTYHDVISLLGQPDQILGTSECGATIVAVETAPGSTTYMSATPLTGTAFTLNVAALALTAYSYNVTATDLAGNTSAITVVSGNALL